MATVDFAALMYIHRPHLVSVKLYYCCIDLILIAETLKITDYSAGSIVYNKGYVLYIVYV